MYHGRSALRWLVYLGTLGLAGIAPGRERFPAWAAVALGVLPIGLYELGAGIYTDSVRPRWLRLGVRLQLAGGVAYAALLAAATAGGHSPALRGFWWLFGMACLGLVASAVVWWDWLRLGRGEAPVAADPLAAGDHVAKGRGRAADMLAIVGGTPLILGALSLVFVAMAIVVLVRRGGHAPPMVWIGLAFFGGGALTALGQALDRWETFVPSSRIRGVRAAVKLLAFELFGGALVAFGVLQRGEPDGSTARAWAMIVFGAFCMLGGLAYVLRLSGIGRRAAGYAFVREGLLERTRRASYLYPWAAIAEVSLGEFQHMMAVYVRLADDGLVQGPIEAAPVARTAAADARLARRRRGLRRSRGLFGADLIVMEAMTGEPVGDLFRTADAGLGDEAARAALPSAREHLASRR